MWIFLHTTQGVQRKLLQNIIFCLIWIQSSTDNFEIQRISDTLWWVEWKENRLTNMKGILSKVILQRPAHRTHIYLIKREHIFT